MNICKYLLFLLLLTCTAFAQIRLETPHVESMLYLGSGKKQPLVVGIGGSEGGNAWASDHWKRVRDQFLEKGYAFLAVGYFGAKGTPDTLNKIALEDVYGAIAVAAKHKSVDRKKIALIGGSRGADLALLLGSQYDAIQCVVSIVGSSAVFPGHTLHFSTSCFTFEGRELPFVPVNDAAIPFLMQGNLRGCFEAMLQDTAAARLAAIPVERIHGPILFLSAAEDEICPSTPMAQAMVTRLESKGFAYPVVHEVILGSHAAPLQQFDLVFRFLDAHFAKAPGPQNGRR